MTTSENELRESIVHHGRSLFDRGLAAGSSGNISARLDDGWLLTPTDSCLGQLDPAVVAALGEELEPADNSSATRPEHAVEARQVFEYISALPDDFRDALVAVDVVGLSYGEAAKLLGTKEATITSRLYRARAQVARGMDPSRESVL